MGQKSEDDVLEFKEDELVEEGLLDDESEPDAAALAAEESSNDEIFARDDSHKAMDATQIYLGEIGFSPLLSAEEEVYFSRLALRGDAAARKRMIESNLRLVVKIARRYVNRGLSLLDLIEAADIYVTPYLGMQQAKQELQAKNRPHPPLRGTFSPQAGRRRRRRPYSLFSPFTGRRSRQGDEGP